MTPKTNDTLSKSQLRVTKQSLLDEFHDLQIHHIQQQPQQPGHRNHRRIQKSEPRNDHTGGRKGRLTMTLANLENSRKSHQPTIIKKKGKSELGIE